jgi:hypothetical protein
MFELQLLLLMVLPLDEPSRIPSRLFEQLLLLIVLLLHEPLRTMP